MTACHQLQVCMIPCQLPSTATRNAILTNPLVNHIWLNIVRAPYMQFIILLMPRDCRLAVHEILKLATWLTIACHFFQMDCMSQCEMQMCVGGVCPITLF